MRNDPIPRERRGVAKYIAEVGDPREARVDERAPRARFLSAFPIARVAEQLPGGTARFEQVVVGVRRVALRCHHVLGDVHHVVDDVRVGRVQLCRRRNQCAETELCPRAISRHTIVHQLFGEVTQPLIEPQLFELGCIGEVDAAAGVDEVLKFVHQCRRDRSVHTRLGRVIAVDGALWIGHRHVEHLTLVARDTAIASVDRKQIACSEEAGDHRTGRGSQRVDHRREENRHASIVIGVGWRAKVQRVDSEAERVERGAECEQLRVGESTRRRECVDQHERVRQHRGDARGTQLLGRRTEIAGAVSVERHDGSDARIRGNARQARAGHALIFHQRPRKVAELALTHDYVRPLP